MSSSKVIFFFLIYFVTSYLSDPGDESSHTGEDCGSLRGVAASAIHKTSHTFNIPPSISAFTV